MKKQKKMKRHAKGVPFRALRAQSPAAFCLRQNRQDRRSAERRIKFSIKVQLCRTFIPLPAPRRRGLVRCADERGGIAPGFSGTGGVSKGDSVPLGRAGQICGSRLTSSIAAIAASAPLLPAFVPARSIACSMFSVVMTPNVTGTPVWRPTCAMPLAVSLHTSS